MRFSGSFVPLITPFTSKGRLDKKTVVKLIEWHISQGTDGIVCSATTGEGPTLNDADRKAMADLCIQTAARRVPVIVATGINDTRTSIRYTETAQKLGADGCLAVTPYYNKPSQRGCILHFTEMAKVGLPVILYHNPPRTAVRLSIETIRELSQVPNIVAIKESSYDLAHIQKIAPFIDVFGGDDDLNFQILKAGGVGTIATTANLLPRAWKKLVTLCQQKKWEEGEKIAKKILPLIKAVFLETNPQGIKFALSWLRQCSPIFRLPLILPTEATQKEIKKAILHLALPLFSSPSPIFS